MTGGYPNSVTLDSRVTIKGDYPSALHQRFWCGFSSRPLQRLRGSPLPAWLQTTTSALLTPAREWKRPSRKIGITGDTFEDVDAVPHHLLLEMFHRSGRHNLVRWLVACLHFWTVTFSFTNRTGCLPAR